LPPTARYPAGAIKTGTMNTQNIIAEEDLERLRQLAKKLPPDVRLRITLTRHETSDAFQAFGRQIKAAAPGIDLLTDITGETDPPWMETAGGIRFQALPSGNKLDSLMDALKPFRREEADLSPAHRDFLDRMALPVEVRLFIAPACPFCPRALQQWVTLARAGDNLRLRVIDGALFPEMVREANIQAVPTLVLDDQLRWSGQIPVTDVLEQAVDRDLSRLSAEALEGIIKEGQAGQLARAMMDKGALFPAIFDLLAHAKWPVRLGAMVVMEEIAAADRRLAAEALPVLHQRYTDLDDAVRGDMLYLIGEIGDPGSLSFLQDIARTGTNPEIVQAAREAVTAIEDRDLNM